MTTPIPNTQRTIDTTGSMVDNLMNSGEESSLPMHLFSALTVSERTQLCIHRMPVEVTLQQQVHEVDMKYDDGEDIERERVDMMQAGVYGILDDTTTSSVGSLPIKQSLTKEEIIEVGKTRTRNVWASTPAATRKTPADHDDYDLDEETIPGLEEFADGGGGDDALLLAALGDTTTTTSNGGAASEEDGRGLASVQFDNFSVDVDPSESTAARSPFPFGDNIKVPRASRSVHSYTASQAIQSNPLTTQHQDPEPTSTASGDEDSDDQEEELDALALLDACCGGTNQETTIPLDTIGLRGEVRAMMEEHTETEILPFSAPASDDEDMPLTIKPMTPFE